MLIITDISDLKSLVGESLGISGWYQISQSHINRFAEATGDNQWIHVDVEKCRTQSPFGKTITHGHLVLSLIPKFFYECVYFSEAGLTINYGLNRVRFTHPVAVDSYLRARFSLQDLQEVTGGVRLFTESIFQIKDLDKPACVAESILQVMWK